MALSDSDVRAQYNGDGSTTTFAIPAAEIDGFSTETKVYIDDTLQTLTTDYTISSTNVVFNSAPASGTNNITIIRQLSLTQPTDLAPTGAVDLDAIESALDRLAALIQQVEEKTDRAALLKLTSSFTGLTLPEPSGDAVLTWNTGATDLENKTATEVLALTGALVAANNLSDLADAAAALGNLGLTATAAELNYSDGVTSNIQTQLDGKEPTVSLTASRALQSSSGGGLEASSVTSTELGYVSGVTSAIQTQMDTKAPTANPDFTGEVDLTDQAQLNFFEGSGGGSNRLSMKAPATLSGDVDWILPSADGGSGQYLGTDGAGNLSFSNPPSGFSNPMTTGGDLIYGGGSGVAARLANGSDNQYLRSQGGTSAPAWESIPAVTVQTFTSGSGTYTTPSGCTRIKVKLVGGGGGGGGSGTSNGTIGGTGGTTSFGTRTATGGTGAQRLVGGAAGAGGGSGYTVVASIAGQKGGGGGVNSTVTPGQTLSGIGGNSGGGLGFGGSTNAGGDGSNATGYGGGGGGGGNDTTAGEQGGGGGGGGGYSEFWINSPSATYSYAVGAGGAAGAAGTSGRAGGAGTAGVIIVEEFYY